MSRSIPTVFTRPQVDDPASNSPIYSPEVPLQKICKNSADLLSGLSMEILCRILSYLSLKDIMRMEMTCNRMRYAVTMHLRLVTTVDFTNGFLYGYMPSAFTDETLRKFLSRCPDLKTIKGLHPRDQYLHRRQHRRACTLSVPGIVSALQCVEHLQGIETCNIFVLQAVLSYFPNIQILGKFRNRNGRFPPLEESRLDLASCPRVSHLSLVGVMLESLPNLEHVKYLMLKWVKFTDPYPFRDFATQNLRTFIMNNCIGPHSALHYVQLINALSTSHQLQRLELIRVPLLGGLLQHMVEESWRSLGFRTLQKLLIGSCKYVQEMDVGFLAIACSRRLEELFLQPSLTRDSFFISLNSANVHFPYMQHLYLGYVDDFPPKGKWSTATLSEMGLMDVVEAAPVITDQGVSTALKVFSSIQSLTLVNCPHLINSSTWFTPGISTNLLELHLRKCYSVRLFDFTLMLRQMRSLKSLTLEHMFKEPPKGCSRVGLSAGTGLGVASAFVSNPSFDTANLNNNDQNDNSNPNDQNHNPANPNDQNHNPANPTCNDQNDNPANPNGPSLAHHNLGILQPANQGAEPTVHEANQVAGDIGLAASQNEEIRNQSGSEDADVNFHAPYECACDFNTLLNSNLKSIAEGSGANNIEVETAKRTVLSQSSYGGSISIGIKSSSSVEIVNNDETVQNLDADNITTPVSTSKTNNNNKNQKLTEYGQHLPGASVTVQAAIPSKSNQLICQSSIESFISESLDDRCTSIPNCSSAGRTTNIVGDDPNIATSSDKECFDFGVNLICAEPSNVQSQSSNSSVSQILTFNSGGHDRQGEGESLDGGRDRFREIYSSVGAESSLAASASSMLTNREYCKRDSFSNFTNSCGSVDKSCIKRTYESITERTPVGFSGSLHYDAPTSNHCNRQHFISDTATIDQGDKSIASAYINEIESSNAQSRNDDIYSGIKTSTSRGRTNLPDDEAPPAKHRRASRNDLCRIDSALNSNCVSMNDSIYSTSGLKHCINAISSSQPALDASKDCGRGCYGVISDSSFGANVSTCGASSSNFDATLMLGSRHNISNLAGSGSSLNVTGSTCSKSKLCDTSDASHSSLVAGTSRNDAGSSKYDSTTNNVESEQLSSSERGSEGDMDSAHNGNPQYESCARSTVRKGKSLTGAKKGIVKRLVGMKHGNAEELVECSHHQSSAVTDKACQAVSREIRESSRGSGCVGSGVCLMSAKVYSSDGECISKSPSWSKNRGKAWESRNISDVGMESLRSRARPKMVDKCTSTSDPVLEDDTKQVLTVCSSSLVSITLHQVGVTDLEIVAAPKLQTLTGSACRVLVNVTVGCVPKLHRVSFVQCKKLSSEVLVNSVCSQPAERSKLIFLRPMYDYDETSMAKMLFSSVRYDYQLALIHDDSSPQSALTNRLMAATWLEIVSNVNTELLREREGFVRGGTTKTGRTNYPWNRYLHITHGNKCNERWHMMSDLPWIGTLAAAAPRYGLGKPTERDRVYNPSAKGHLNARTCFTLLEQDIAEACESLLPLYPYAAIVYVNTCDLTASSVCPDPYA